MKIIGHRGAAGLGPENSLAAIKKALGFNVDEIEVDVRVNADGLVILSHDKYVKSGAPTLAQAIETVNKTCPLIIEIKPGENVGQIVNVIKRYLSAGWPAGTLKVASFSQKCLLEVRNLLPEIPIIVLEKWSGIRASRRARQLKTKQIAMNQRWLWWGFIRSMARAGYQLTAYTMNRPEQARHWQKHGLYGVVTDYPDRFRSYN